MPNLWDDYTTDEAAAAAGFTHRSNIVKRIHADKQPAHQGPYKANRWRYWITATELEEAMQAWPRYAKKRRQAKELRDSTTAPNPAACPALPLKCLDTHPPKRDNHKSNKRKKGHTP